jgi:sugar porter (SP) family MFS transporter
MIRTRKRETGPCKSPMIHSSSNSATSTTLPATRTHTPLSLYLILVCFVGSTGGFLFGFDTSVISGVIEYISSPKVFNLGEIAKGWTVSCIIIGCMVGCVVAGPLSSRFGRRKSLLFTAIVFFLSALGCALSNSLVTFVEFRIVAGVAVGAASMLAPMYIAELAPPWHRGKLVALNVFTIFLGQSSAFYSNYFLRNFGGTASWRWMLGIMTVPSFLLLASLLFAPESPRWLIQKQRHEPALKVLKRINGEKEAEREFAEIEESLRSEAHGEFGECFRGGMRRILIIGILLAIFQQVTGINIVMYYAPAIFKSAGFGNSSALFQTALMGIMNLTFSVVSMFFVDKVGRKPLMVIGCIGMGIAMFLTAGTFLSGHARGYLLLGCIMGYLAAFAFTLGPVVWVLIAELFPNRVRSYAVAITTFMLWAANFVVSLTFPYLLDSLRGYSFVIYGSMCVLCLFFVLKYLHETKGKTLEEIEADIAGYNSAQTT